jgi:hypothetical protein
MIEIRVEVEPIGDKLLRFSWGNSTKTWSQGSYSVPRNYLEKMATEVRKALEALVADGLNNKFAQKTKCLNALADKGGDLRDAIFRKSTEGDGGAGDPEKIRARLAELRAKDQVQLNFNVPSGVHYPWGLAFDTPIDAQPKPDGNLGVFENFWALKYRHSTTYVGIDDYGLDTPVSSLSVVSVESPVVMDRVDGYLAELKKNLQELALQKLEEVHKVRIELQDRFQVITKRDELFQKWQQIKDQVVLVHFYCHADGAQLSLGILDEQQIKVTAFQKELKRIPGGKSVPCLVFMNGCLTAIGDPKDGFLEATGSSGYCGFIGTETKIPDVFALRFGMAFLHEFLKGVSVVEVMDRLRRKHWPLGLAYSTYCYPSISVSPAAPLGDLDEVNYCDSYLGTTEMI